MKKVLAFILTTVLALTALTAAAAPSLSPEKLEGVIVSATAKDFRIILEDATTDRSVYNAALEQLKTTEGITDLKIVDHKTIRIEGAGTPKYPLAVELNIPGIKATSKGYVLFKNSDGTIEKLDTTVASGKVTVSFKTLPGEFVFVTDSQTITDINSAGKTDDKTPPSPQTADHATPIAFALLAVSAAAAIVSVKKIKACK